MNDVVVQSSFVIKSASQNGLVDACIVPAGSGMMKYPCMLPTIPASKIAALERALD